MTSPSIDAALVLTKDGHGRGIAASEIVPTVRSGGVVVLPRALHRVGFQQPLVEMTLRVIGDVAGSAAREHCRRVGIERLHEVLPAPQIERLAHDVDARLRHLYPALMKALGHQALGLRRGFYIHWCPQTRIMVPRGTPAFDEERFNRRHNRSKLRGHPPHRDYWLDNPINSINLWMAVGPVERENGLFIYTDMWAKPVIRDAAIARDEQALGTPLTFALQAGDIAVFDNRQLHASVVNGSATTRVAYTGRLCLRRPIAPQAAALDAITLWSPLIGTRLEPFAGVATKISAVYQLERLKRLATAGVASIERRLGSESLRMLRKVLRYRRADRPFGT